MARKTWLWFLGIMVTMLVLVGWGFLLKMDLEKKNRREEFYVDRGLPVINISLNNVSLEEINSGSKEIKYEGNELTLWDGDEVFEYDGVEIKGRGNGTWAQEKKPYQIKFDKKVNFLGMGKARKWYLLANALDDTYLRNGAAFYMARMLDGDYPFNGKFMELYVNGDYLGLYYLTRAVEISKDLVGLRDLMGILVELDNLYGGIEKNYKTRNGDLLVVKDIMDRDKEEIAMVDFLGSYNDFEIAVAEEDYGQIKELVDVESFAQYYLLSEFTVNPDAYWTSFYMYKDGNKDRIHAGPGWDFDFALGNRKWANWLGELLYSPTETMVRSREFSIDLWKELGYKEDDFDSGVVLSHIVFDLMKMPEFQDEVKRVFQDKMSGRKEEFLREILRTADMISLAAEADGEKWEKEGFSKEVEEMVDWIGKRYDYFEREYGKEEKVLEVKSL